MKLQSLITISVWTSFSHLFCMFKGSIFTFNMYWRQFEIIGPSCLSTHICLYVKHQGRLHTGTSHTNLTKYRGELMCSGRVGSSWSTNGTRRVTRYKPGDKSWMRRGQGSRPSCIWGIFYFKFSNIFAIKKITKLRII
jgi:hypothetical protein